MNRAKTGFLVHYQYTPTGLGGSAGGELELLAAAYGAGAGVLELAAAFGVSRETVHQQLNRLGVPRRPRGLTPSQIEIATSMYKDGASLVAVGELFDVDPSTVWRSFRRAGIAMRPRSGWTGTATTDLGSQPRSRPDQQV